ncbi:MAG: hypothetical protein AVDCRST_MAG41-2532, partial [uncultured Corynebacteriales bacterium]
GAQTARVVRPPGRRVPGGQRPPRVRRTVAGPVAGRGRPRPGRPGWRPAPRRVRRGPGGGKGGGG